MNKRLLYKALLFFFLMVSPAFGLDVSVDIKGPQDLVSLKDGIARTVTARCLARNVTAEANAALSVSIFQMGSTISFDAILSSTPPKAFHRDLKSADELSGTIDAMIDAVFDPASPAPAQTKPSATAATGQAKTEAKLTFAATSVASLGDSLFVSSSDTVYLVEGGKSSSWWKAPRGAEICRLYPYRGTILAVASLTNNLYTYQIRDGKTVKQWDRCVVPSKDGLISARLFTDKDLSTEDNLWGRPEAVEGSPLLFPEGTDILSTLSADVLPEGGEETVSFDKFNRVVISRGKEVLWASDSKFSTLPSYVVTSGPTASTGGIAKKSQTEGDIRYYFMPRVLVNGGEIVTFANQEGVSGLFGRVKIYNATRIVAFKPEDTGFAEVDLEQVKNNYCADIALDKGDVLALIVKKSTSYIQRISLQ
ncbi:MAG TPA: hypothetical protein PKM41_11825 [Deltaproteobacteria bacterium]|nr:hypothetical protein [Deltaproteobacteria bacterium]HOI07831.1 hypothetical protein [Deltaproteobacteria bacterium]